MINETSQSSYKCAETSHRETDRQRNRETETERDTETETETDTERQRETETEKFPSRFKRFLVLFALAFAT